MEACCCEKRAPVARTRRRLGPGAEVRAGEVSDTADQKRKRVGAVGQAGFYSRERVRGRGTQPKKERSRPTQRVVSEDDGGRFRASTEVRRVCEVQELSVRGRAVTTAAGVYDRGMSWEKSVPCM